jgi:hypothetical protein
MNILLDAGSHSLVQVTTFAVAALLMIVAGLDKQRLRWRLPDRPRRRRWFRRGDRAHASGRLRR